MHPSTITIISINPQWNVKELDDLLIDFTTKSTINIHPRAIFNTPKNMILWITPAFSRAYLPSRYGVMRLTLLAHIFYLHIEMVLIRCCRAATRTIRRSILLTNRNQDVYNTMNFIHSQSLSISRIQSILAIIHPQRMPSDHNIRSSGVPKHNGGICTLSMYTHN